MRIPIWRDLRLSVWERQNPEAVRITMACYYNPIRVRRILSSRGWALFGIRYDWRDRGKYVPGKMDPRIAEARMDAFNEAADLLREIDPAGFREAANVCEALALRTDRDRHLT